MHCHQAACISSLLALHFATTALDASLGGGDEAPSATGVVPCADMRRYRPVILCTIGWCALYFCFLQGQAAAAFWIHKKRRASASRAPPEAPQSLARTSSGKAMGAAAPSAAPLSPGRERSLSGEREFAAIPFAAVKYGQRAEVRPGLIFVMDRSVGNLLEQTPPFLLGLWLHAMAATPLGAARLGWIWLLLRASYPVAFAYPSMSPALWGVQRRLGISWVSFVTWPSYAVVWTLLYGAADVCW